MPADVVEVVIEGVLNRVSMVPPRCEPVDTLHAFDGSGDLSESAVHDLTVMPYERNGQSYMDELVELSIPGACQYERVVNRDKDKRRAVLSVAVSPARGPDLGRVEYSRFGDCFLARRVLDPATVARGRECQAAEAALLPLRSC